jgi:hypothetical protein
MNRAELIAYFMRALRSGRSPDTDEETLTRSAAAMADAFLENRVERPSSERGEPFAPPDASLAFLALRHAHEE